MAGGENGASLAGVVDLDLLVDVSQDAPHLGLQPVKLGCFLLQQPLIFFIRFFQFWVDEREKVRAEMENARWRGARKGQHSSHIPILQASIKATSSATGFLPFQTLPLR